MKPPGCLSQPGGMARRNSRRVPARKFSGNSPEIPDQNLPLI